MKKLSVAITMLLVCLISSTAFAQITGPTSYCTGHNDTLHGLPAGGSWTSSNTAVATISAAGIVTPIAAGTSSISYSSWPTAVVITVNASPSAGSVLGTSISCGATTTFTSTVAGGTWSSSAPGVATINASTGIASGLSVGSATITYTTGPGSCGIATTTAVLNVVGGFAGTVTGLSTICVGGSSTLSSTVTGGTWSTSDPALSVSAGGVVTGVSAGTGIVTYSATTPCGPSISGIMITVLTPGTAGPIGPTSVACGSALILSCVPSGGTWTSSTPSVASISASSGMLTAVSPGTSIITYTALTPCGIGTTTAPITVPPTPTGSIYGTSIVCGGSTTFSSWAAGGTWTSSTPGVATIGLSTGIATGVSAGTTTITYTVGSGSCGIATTTAVLYVGAGFAGTITGPDSVCVGSLTSYTSTIAGGTWSSSSPALSITTGGVVAGVSAGTGAITYTAVGVCGPVSTTSVITVVPLAAAGAIIGSTSVVCGSSGSLSFTSPGGTWSSSTPSVVTIAPTGTGAILTGVSSGTSTITYTMTTPCDTAITTVVVHVSVPPITVFIMPEFCDANVYGLALNADTYVWAPATGLSCTACATPTITASVTTVYTITGTSSCGTTSAFALVDANQVKGHINFSGPIPSPSYALVYLMRIDPADSSIVEVDTLVTCYDSATSSQYYHFDGKPAGEYVVSALAAGFSTPAYIPTYGGSSPNWFSATHISHTATTTNVQDIALISATGGTTGTGSISGYVYAAGSSAGVNGMLVHLKNTAGQVVAVDYTNSTGFYTFSGLAMGSYVVYPEHYWYYTTPSSVITLSSDAPIATNVIFRQFDIERIIVPPSATAVGAMNANNAITIHPNPTSGAVIISWQNQTPGSGSILVTDMVGREVYRTALNITAVGGEQTIDLNKLNAGAYIINVRSEEINHTVKLVLDK